MPRRNPRTTRDVEPESGPPAMSLMSGRVPRGRFVVYDGGTGALPCHVGKEGVCVVLVALESEEQLPRPNRAGVCAD